MVTSGEATTFVSDTIDTGDLLETAILGQSEQEDDLVQLKYFRNVRDCQNTAAPLNAVQGSASPAPELEEGYVTWAEENVMPRQKKIRGTGTATVHAHTMSTVSNEALVF